MVMTEAARPPDVVTVPTSLFRNGPPALFLAILNAEGRGEEPTRESLAIEIGVSWRTLVRWRAVLECEGLVEARRYSSRGDIFVTLSDDGSYLSMRGRVAGLKSSLQRALKARDKERQVSAQLRADLHARQRSNERTRVDVVARIWADHEHALDCCDPECERCEHLQRYAEDGLDDSLREAADRAHRLDQVADASLQLMRSLVDIAPRAKSPGALTRYARALRALNEHLRHEDEQDDGPATSTWDAVLDMGEDG